jgi:uncharacterized protein
MCTARDPAVLPHDAVGFGLRAAHVREILDGSPDVDFLEIHSENYFAASGPHLDALYRLRERFPVSAHGVGASLGSADGPCPRHLDAVARLVECIEPALVSEHLAWGAIDGIHSNDLLPLPYTDEALAQMIGAVDRAQDRLALSLLIENVSSYVTFALSTIPEWEFLAALAAKTGCGILLDVNNIDVSARNHGFDPRRYIDTLPRGSVRELHVAGHSVQRFGNEDIVVDTHDRGVAPSTWALLRHALRRFGAVPILIEWDADLPPLAVLEAEVARARTCVREVCDRAA